MSNKDVITQGFFGRKQIYTSFEGVTRENVNQLISDTYPTHQMNVSQMKFLERYYKGEQPILCRTKEIRDDINNKVTVNRAKQIADFTTAFFAGDPLKYVVRNPENRNAINGLSKLNAYLTMCRRTQVDLEVAEWQGKVGTGYKITLPKSTGSIPFRIHSVDPKDCYVVYSDDYKREPIANITVYIDEHQNTTFGVYTLLPKPRFFKVFNGEIKEDVPYLVGELPIQEYPLNSARVGAFESVLPILDAINLLESNRLDGVEQFIQSLLVFYNCTLGEDEDGNAITPQILREQGALFLKSVGENKADVKEISAQLDQQQTQVLVNNLWQSALTIVGMPSQGDGNTGDSSNNGAVSMKNGWQDANIRTKERDLFYIASDMVTTDIILRICRQANVIDLDVTELEIRPTRRNQDNLLVKVQSLTTMLGSGLVAPVDAYASVDLFPDPEEAAQRGIEWYNKVKADTQLKVNENTTI